MMMDLGRLHLVFRVGFLHSTAAMESGAHRMVSRCSAFNTAGILPWDLDLDLDLGSYSITGVILSAHGRT